MSEKTVEPRKAKFQQKLSHIQLVASQKGDEYFNLFRALADALQRCVVENSGQAKVRNASI